ncbi:MAG: type I DNA topoisomerase [Chloroflexota bacterium]|nr:MAG: type I DNA topoisomerase [Chloroflexota bacterium]
MRLVIVESPKKARTLAGFLGRDYRVEASFGHVRDLPPKRLGIDIGDNFAAEWLPVPRAAARITALRRDVRQAERVILATDPDREGEAIAWHLAESLGLRSAERVTFHAITARAVTEAFKSPRALDTRLVEAQQARRVLDRLVGYQVSPLLWKKIARGTSAGRVQSVALRLIVDREREIEAFRPEPYWTIDVTLRTRDDRPHSPFVARVTRVGPDEAPLRAADATEGAVADLKGAAYAVESVDETTAERSPPPPYTTSSLQQVASHRLRWSGKKTMSVAQSLYEAGLITYHRTDAVRVEPEAVAAARATIAERFGQRYLAASPRQYATRGTHAQEAHEAIRPTDPGSAPDAQSRLAADDRALYQVIWQRFIASQMAASRHDQRTLAIAARGTELYALKATASRLAFDGYLRVYGVGADDESAGSSGRRSRGRGAKAGSPSDRNDPGDEIDDGDAPMPTNEWLPDVSAGEPLDRVRVTSDRHETRPPPRFSEPALIRALERAGVGRPSTYASIVATLEDRAYVARENRVFVPTGLGRSVCDFVVAFFPTVADIGFTVEMEQGLDAIARGEASQLSILNAFYRPFRQALDIAARAAVSFTPTDGPAVGVRSEAPPPVTPKRRRAPRVPPPDPLTRRSIPRGSGRPEPEAVRPVGEACPLCGSPMTERRGPFSRFLGCTGFPRCRGTISLDEPAEPPTAKPAARKRRVAPRAGGTRTRARTTTRPRKAKP